MNLLWEKNFSYAQKFYQEILSCEPYSVAVIGLIEDGLLEEVVQPSVVLFAEMLWDPFREPKELIELTKTSYFDIQSH